MIYHVISPSHCPDLEIKQLYNGTHITLEWVKPTQTIANLRKKKIKWDRLYFILLSSIKCFLLGHLIIPRRSHEGLVTWFKPKYSWWSSYISINVPSDHLKANVSGAIYVIYRLADFLNNYLPSESYKWLIFGLKLPKKYPAIHTNIYVYINSEFWVKICNDWPNELNSKNPRHIYLAL